MIILKCKVHSNLVRDTNTNAIINKDKSAYNLAKRRAEEAQRQRDEIRGATREINNLKCEMHEIKSMLKTLLERDNMAISTQIATTNTLENFRQQFNNLQTDVNGLESGTLTFSSVSATTTSTSSLNILEDGTIVFEGATNDSNETTLTVADPTADRTITLPDATGTVFLTNTTDTTIFTDKTALSSGDVAGGSDVLLVADVNVTTLKKITVDDLVSSAGGLTSLAGDSTPQLGGDLDVNGNKITSASNANVEIEPNGTGDILLDADLVTLGSGTEVGHLSTPGTQDLKLSTNSGTNSGTIEITDGANNNITLTPNGTGDVALVADTVVVGDSNAWCLQQ